jgi:hypothetical protein
MVAHTTVAAETTLGSKMASHEIAPGYKVRIIPLSILSQFLSKEKVSAW